VEARGPGKVTGVQGNTFVCGHNLLCDCQALSGGETAKFVLTLDGMERVPLGGRVTEKHRRRLAQT
jgi:hypothetical protein